MFGCHGRVACHVAAKTTADQDHGRRGVRLPPLVGEQIAMAEYRKLAN
jgi:hypothetical protein